MFLLKRQKCFFAQESMVYLGRVISSKDVAPIQSMITTMVEWGEPEPRASKRMGYYRSFIKSYATIAHSIVDLLKKKMLSFRQKIPKMLLKN